MAAPATQDDDLLIIADDSSDSDSGDIDFSFDFGDENKDEEVNQKAETETATITQTEEWTSLDQEVSIVAEPDSESSILETEEVSSLIEVSEAPSEEVVSQEEVSTEAKTSEEVLDFGLDLTSDEVSETPEVEEVSVEETNTKEEISFDLGISDETTGDIQEEVSVEETGTATGGWSTWDDSSMNDILSATIAKLTARKASIASQKEEKLKHEDEIKAQITALQDEHAGIEQELTGLDSESNKITANIDELEGMKMDPVKEHNAKRVAKKK